MTTMTRPTPPSALYTLALRACAWLVIIVSAPVLVALMLLKKKWRSGFKQRLGFIPALPPHPMRLWVHAISVGETEAARPLINALRRRYPQADIVLSTTTQTGRARAAQLMPDVRRLHYPLDLPWAVSRVITRVNPAAIIMVEPEWWPVFLITAAHRRTPLIMLNVRITQRALTGYLRVRSLMRRMLRTASAIAVQEDVYARRLLQLGAAPDRLRITGQMKYDNIRIAPDAPTAAAGVAGTQTEPVAGPAGPVARLAAALGLDASHPVLVAGSTGPGEEEILLDAYDLLRKNHPSLRLAIIPRKPERFDEVAALIRARGFNLIRRSQSLADATGSAGGAANATIGSPIVSDESAPTQAQHPVILGDTMGELMNFYALARVVFVGRSLVPMGGSNPIDPASLALPLLFGPHMYNFPDAEELFVAGNAARVVTDAPTLAAATSNLLDSPEVARQMGARARAAIVSRQGATQQNVELINDVLKSSEIMLEADNNE